MACEYCGDLEKLADIRRRLGPDIELNHCPVCGEYLAAMSHIREFKVWINNLAVERLQRAIINNEKLTDTVEIDGKTLKVEYQPSNVKPMDIGINLDKVDISREVELLKKHVRHSLHIEAN